MSVMLLDKLHFETVSNGLFSHKLDGLLFSERAEIIISWFEMNCYEYSTRYNEKVEAFKPELNNCDYLGSPDKVALLKLLQCIKYNTPEYSDFKGSTNSYKWMKALESLDYYIEKLKMDIIRELTDYENLSWTF